MTLLAIVLFCVVFGGMITLVVKLSGRRFPGDITGDQGNPVDYDDYHVGWNIFAHRDTHGAGPQSRGENQVEHEDFAQWEAEHGAAGPTRDEDGTGEVTGGEPRNR